MAEFNVWLLIVGLAAGAAVTWLVMGTIARNDDDVAADERGVEAAWIARTIEERGGRAPLKLVEQILTFHRRYLKGGAGVPQPGTTLEPASDEPLVPEPEAPEPVAPDRVAPEPTPPKTAQRAAGGRKPKSTPTGDQDKPGASVAS